MAHIAGDKAMLARARRLGGQVGALERALLAGADCAAVLQQLAAVRGALNGLTVKVLDAHLRHHVAAPGLSDAQREAEVETIGALLKSYLR
ncbi:metal/formaldehyde-sensitive transcriptional repressor [Coralloluteibacterium stylophorae]|uniref:Metal/formaldehyde-sensitive transcriptional repressor n=1 Tax=Coralloluteibacterium stylophorae TaxID=1776034 RepID=A0A8J7VQ41_9GAMM|nr:metal/formaldehyde-sensitive transcriptional repressor [Coralloluteibacterium stylophorae]MBS7457291.1 metal/formaldehyde-sensitive transcriptional repressor [Coralloluteibacterium stylophorae]